MNLREIPTTTLLMEIARRCEAAENHSMLAPGWAVGILQVVADHEGVTLRELMEVSSRSEAAATLRHTAMALLRGLLPHRSLEEIAGLWKQDHATVIHAIRRIDAKCATDPLFLSNWLSLVEAASPHARRRSARQVVAGDPAPAAR